MSEPQAVAYRIERLRDGGYFVPILIDANGFEFLRLNVCACADQAAYTATRGRTRPLEYRGMTGMRQGRMEPCDDRDCSVAREHWTWANHGHTHGSLG
jgi:hypothetical protein